MMAVRGGGIGVVWRSSVPTLIQQQNFGSGGELLPSRAGRIVLPEISALTRLVNLYSSMAIVLYV
jgi:hypothetical protein